jgi:hypothetical protein
MRNDVKAIVAALVLLCATVTGAEAKMTLAERGKARCVIVRQPGATSAERYAAEELANTLRQITGAAVEVRDTEPERGEAAIIVGPGPSASAAFPEVRLLTFGAEQVAIRTKGNRLLLAGGRTRGTLYAVYRFLQDQCGVRWWTPWATTIPKKATLTVGDLAIDTKPAFESRDPFWFPAFDGDWAARNFANGQTARLTEKHGGKILYKGFVHTFYPLVPPDKNFAAHPEWYSLINGKRTVEGGQLCTTNPALRAFVADRVREWIKESPEASIVSVSQNDWHGVCQCPDCKAVDEREGGHSGTMLSFVNDIAARIGPEFPHVAFDTLAYQYTRKAPKTVTPLPNVIVRLCSIECNFGAPLEDASNKSFANDLRAWDQKSDRLYIWDYATNFAHYPLPHPNWFSLGPNVRFFHRNGARGLFEQGAYQSHGGEMAELRAWVLARLLWNPQQDDRKLIDEFLVGYYGRAAARPIRRYMDLLHRKAKGFYLTCYNSPSAPFLDLPTLTEAERLWQQAESAVKNDPDLLWRVRQGHLPVRYAFLQRWSPLRRDALEAGTLAAWPLPSSRKAVADEWLAVATGPGPAGWSRMTLINEGGTTPEAFVARFAQDPPEPTLPVLPERAANPPAPADLPGVTSGVDGQDGLARLFNEGEFAEVRADAGTSDGLAVWMPGSHHEWAFQIPVAKLAMRAQTGTWKVYAVIRVEKANNAAPQSPAFTAGVYDTAANSGPANVSVSVADAASAYKSYLLGTVTTNKDQYIWVAPTANAGVKAVWVDRVYLVLAK